MQLKFKCKNPPRHQATEGIRAVARWPIFLVHRRTTITQVFHDALATIHPHVVAGAQACGGAAVVDFSFHQVIHGVL
ncbi:MAG: hypothetical protein P8Z00_10190 [Anaerolineales bacterium]|jgi:hypothetical protein